MLEPFYKNKKIFITGHTGFKGSWLSLWLIQMGAEITGYALDPYTPQDFYVVNQIEQFIKDNRGDLRDRELLEKCLTESEAEIVFHLAAQPLVRKSYDVPHETFDVNVMGTANLLDSCMKVKSVKSVIVVTSDKCYENNELGIPFRETDSLGGKDPYSASKAAAEILAHAYRKSFFSNAGIGLATVRAGNVIGGGDWAEDRIIPDTIRALKSNRVIEVRNPNSTRPWQHVLEPLSGYLWLGKCLYEDFQKYSEPWNFGPEVENFVPVSQLVEKALSVWKSGQWKTMASDGTRAEAKVLKLDCAKSHLKLHWRPVLDFEKTVQMTLCWYQAYCENPKSIGDLSKEQIREYVSLAAKKNILWAQL